MQKPITAIFLSSSLLAIYASSVHATSEDTKITPQIQHDIELLEHFKQIEVNHIKKQISGTIITVGAEPNGCHFDNIQDAIDSASTLGTEFIHIATNQTYNENLVIDDLTVSLIGGYSDCTAAGSPFIQPSNNQVLIDGGNNAPVLQVSGDSQRSSVTLQNLRFIEGFGQAPNGDSAGGGILAYNADVVLSLDNVDVRSNDAEYGAGIAIINGNTDLLMQDLSLIHI